MNSSSSESEIIETLGANNKQEQFVFLLKKWPVLLNKCQTPSVREKKKDALKQFSTEYMIHFGEEMPEGRILKKINNMETEIKRKTGSNKTGNKKIILKKWEESFLNLLDGGNKSAIRQIPGAASTGTVKETESRFYLVTNTVTPPPKRKHITVAETEETKNLSTNELQRLVLLEQLKLIRMQQEEIKEKTKTRTNNNKIIKEEN